MIVSLGFPKKFLIIKSIGQFCTTDTLSIFGYNLSKVVKNCPIDLIIENFLGKPSENIIQLHGDEDIDYCKKIRKRIPNIGIWKAFRIKTAKD